ncbi:MAG TPA: SHOCT domain-containing protein [Candidatus Paceibacterota bacterium]
MEKEYKGYNGTVMLTDKSVIIKRGIKGFLLGGMMLRGDKTIPFSGIAAVQLKKAGLVAGYIQFSVMGGGEAKAGLFQSSMDENTVNFHVYGGKNEQFEELRHLVEERIGNHASGHSVADEIAKLSGLRDTGVLTENEFQKKKKQLLGV